MDLVTNKKDAFFLDIELIPFRCRVETVGYSHSTWFRSQVESCAATKNSEVERTIAMRRVE